MYVVVLFCFSSVLQLFRYLQLACLAITSTGLYELVYKCGCDERKHLDFFAFQEFLAFRQRGRVERENDRWLEVGSMSVAATVANLIVAFGNSRK